jgi:hypothetical protein
LRTSNPTFYLEPDGLDLPVRPTGLKFFISSVDLSAG